MTIRSSSTAWCLLGLAAVLIPASVQAGEDIAKALCPITGEAINLAVSTETDDGPVFFCCQACVKKYAESPDKFGEQVAAQRKVLATRDRVQVKCPVSGNPADPKVFAEQEGRKVHFCGTDCIAKFQADPGKYQRALANAYTYQTKCPVMGEGINPKSFATLATGETIYYCCKGCDRKLQAEPEKYAANLASQGLRINVEKLKASTKDEPEEEHDHDHGDHEGHDH